MSSSSTITKNNSSSFEKLGVSPWLSHQLKVRNNFTSPLPVQSAVLPFATKAFSSWLLHCDIGLSSPTGSGKTLCYCIPLIEAIISQKTKRFSPTANSNDRHVRGVIVVPSAILAEQVNDVLTNLLLPISGQGKKGNKDNNNNSNTAGSPAAPPDFAVGTLFRADDDGSDLYRKQVFFNTTNNVEVKKFFGTVDILIATPQKLCSWIERLADDDDDEDEQRQQLSNRQSNNQKKYPSSSSSSSSSKLIDIFGRTQVVVLDEADDLLSTGFFTSMAGRIVETINDTVQQKGETVLHKMLCSATLTARISKVSDVKLQNAKYFSLDATGNEILGASALSTGTATSAVQNTVSGDIIRQKFPLPASLHEHLVIVRDDAKRHATLLNVVKYALEDLRAKKNQEEQQQQQQQMKSANEDDANGQQQTASIPSWKSKGSSIIVFCQTAEVARVLGHFLSVAGVDALELTTLTTDVERRQAALAVAAAKSTEQKVVVASDALMRGIDLPGVGAVINYDPPTTLQQYIHRVGRTSRAGADGSSYVLLSKMGPSGTEDDGQVALFKSFDAMLLRNGKVSNLVKLRELSDEEAQRADELLMKTRSRLQQQQQQGGVSVGMAIGGSEKQQQQQRQQRTASSNQQKPASSSSTTNTVKDSGKRRARN